MDPNYFNPSMYQNVPASEGRKFVYFLHQILVNWAQLAQRWIVARNLAPSNVPTPRPLMGGPVQPPAFPSPYMDPKSMHTPNVYPPMPIKPPPVNIIYPPAHGGFFSRPLLNVMPPNMPYGGLPPPIRSGLSAGPSTSYVEPNFICEDEEEQVRGLATCKNRIWKSFLYPRYRILFSLYIHLDHPVFRLEHFISNNILKF
jgi:hypothetical protein